MFSNEIYSRLAMPHSLVLHTFALGTVRGDFAASPNAIRFQIGMNPVPAYGNVSIEPFSDVLPLNLNFHEQDGVGRRHNIERDETRQRPPNTFDMAADDEADGGC
jgi:hypothetical protein